MNALQRDLKRLVPLVERLCGPAADAGRYRQQFHIQPPVGWLNDPNGLCRVGDVWHVFYQYGPFDPTGGVKHWGHVTSTDLLHWERQPVMLYPDEPFDCHGAYSGSALYEDGALWLYYTGNVKLPGRYDYIRDGRENNLCLAVSRDCVTMESKQQLMTNREYPSGLSCHVRDPKVWAQDGRYYMVLGARTADDRGEVLVMESEDRLHWRHINTLTTPQPFGYMWECPDLFELDGQWFLAVSPQGIDCANVYGCGYFPLYGDWRGEYTLGEFHTFDYGFDFYAPQSLAADGRRLQFGWMAMPDAPYRGAEQAYGWQNCLTVPRVLTAAPGGHLLQAPAKELEALRGEAVQIPAGEEFTAGPCFEIIAEPCGDFALTLAKDLSLVYTEADRTITLRFASTALGCGRTERSARLASPCRKVQLIADVSSVEIFLNGGEATFTTRYYPAPGPVAARLSGADALLYPLKP